MCACVWKVEVIGHIFTHIHLQTTPKAAHVSTHTHKQTHTHTRKHTSIPLHIHTHTHTPHPRRHPSAPPHTHTHTHTQTHTHTHKHTRTHQTSGPRVGSKPRIVQLQRTILRWAKVHAFKLLKYLGSAFKHSAGTRKSRMLNVRSVDPTVRFVDPTRPVVECKSIWWKRICLY